MFPLFLVFLVFTAKKKVILWMFPFLYFSQCSFICIGLDESYCSGSVKFAPVLSGTQPASQLPTGLARLCR